MILFIYMHLVKAIKTAVEAPAYGFQALVVFPLVLTGHADPIFGGEKGKSSLSAAANDLSHALATPLMPVERVFKDCDFDLPPKPEPRRPHGIGNDITRAADFLFTPVARVIKAPIDFLK